MHEAEKALTDSTQDEDHEVLTFHTWIEVIFKILLVLQGVFILIILIVYCCSQFV